MNDRAQQWMTDAEAMIVKAAKEQQWITTQRHKVVVEIKTFWSSWAVQDTHNLYKLLMDALENAKVFDNDRYGLVNQVDFEKDKDHPRIELRIYVKEDQGVLPPPPKETKKPVKAKVAKKTKKKKTEVKQ